MTTRRLLCIAFLSTLAVLLWTSHPIHGEAAPPGPNPKRILAGRYPLLAHFADGQGDVQLVARVSPVGSVQNLQVVSGSGLLVEPAKEMLSRWIFEPCGVQNCEATVTFHFVLDPGTCANSDCPTEVQVDLPGTVTIRSKHRPAIVN